MSHNLLHKYVYYGIESVDRWIIGKCAKCGLIR